MLLLLSFSFFTLTPSQSPPLTPSYPLTPQLRGLDGDSKPAAKPEPAAAPAPTPAAASSSLPPWLQSKAKRETPEAIENLHRGKPARPDLLEDFRQSSQSSAQSSANGARSRRSKEAAGGPLSFLTESPATAATAAKKDAGGGLDFLAPTSKAAAAPANSGGLPDFLSQGPPRRRTRPSGGLDFLNDDSKPAEQQGSASPPPTSRSGTATISKRPPASNLMDLFGPTPSSTKANAAAAPTAGAATPARQLDQTFNKEELGTSLLGEAAPAGKAQASSGGGGGGGGLPWEAPKGAGRRKPVPGGPMAGALTAGMGGGRRPAGMKVARRVGGAGIGSAGSGRVGVGAGDEGNKAEGDAPLFATPSKTRAAAGRHEPEDDGIEVIAL